MRLTPVLNLPPKFHFWKDFGAGQKRRIPYYKQWWDIWRYEIGRKKVADHTIPADQLPAGSRLMDAEDFMQGHIDLLPEDIIKRKNEKIVYDHPWPFNYDMDVLRDKQYSYAYSIDTRLFVPRDDCLTLTNTLLESDSLEANPPCELATGDIDNIKRQYNWATSQDSVLVRLPKRREWPKINITPTARYGLSKERQETNVLTSMFDYSQTLLARHYHQKKNQTKLNEILSRRTVAFPRSNVLTMRDNEAFSLDLIIDSVTLGRLPLPIVNPLPESTEGKSLVDISPRSWKSVLEKSKDYSSDDSFVLPPDAFLHTIQLASRIKRDYRDPDEMIARCIMHAFGLAYQYKQTYPVSEPVVLQAIGFELSTANFYFVKYQLNSTDFNGDIKNQAWCSKPINSLEEAMRYYLDFQSQSGACEDRHAQRETISMQS